MKKIAFDIDNCLIWDVGPLSDTPKYHTIELLFWFAEHTNWEIYIWSGGGVDYAKRWAEKLGLQKIAEVVAKGSVEVDLAVDDEEVNLGKVCVQI